MFAIHRQIKLLYVLFSLCVLCKKGLELDTISMKIQITHLGGNQNGRTNNI